MKVSVIVAAYNAERYLREMLESIVNQTLEDYEIITVDDGSFDSTPDILAEYKGRYPHFTVIRKENGGPSEARNVALQAAKGKYVYFMDTDDIAEPDSLATMYEQAEKMEADLVIARYDIFNAYGKTAIHDLDGLVKMSDIPRYDTRILWTFSLWNKLFRRSVILENHIMFPPLSYSEDGVFTMNYVYKCGKITGLDRIVLHYRRESAKESSAITASITKDKVQDYIQAHHLILQLAKDSLAENGMESDVDKKTYISQISKKEFQILLNHFYGKFWTLNEEEIHLIVQEMKEKLCEIDLYSITNLADCYPEISFSHLYEKPEEVMASAQCCYVLYGMEEDAFEFLNALRSVAAQNLIAIEIFLPYHMENIVKKDGIWQKNMKFIPAVSEKELLCHAIKQTNALYITIGNKKISYAGNAFKFAFKRFIKSEADFVIEMIYHRNYGEPQAVLLNNAALNSQKGGYGWNEFLSMDNTFANKFFKKDFLQEMLLDYGAEKEKIDEMLRFCYQRGYYAFFNDGIVFYEDKEDTFFDFVAKSDTRPFIQEYLKDKKADFDSLEVLLNPAEVLSKLMKFPSRKTSQILFRKMVSLLRRQKVKNQVLFFSIRKDGELEGNAKALYPYVKGNKIICAKQLPHNMLEELEMYRAVITSKVIVTDDYNRYLRYFPLRKEQRVIQIWHACGAFKKFGQRGTNLPVYTDNATHAQYNIVSVSGEHIRAVYADAFHIDINKVKALGCPRTDVFFDAKRMEEKRENVYAAHPELRDKYVIIYAPTFRDIYKNRNEFHPELDFDKLSKELGENQFFVICPHPVMKNDIVDKPYDNICVIRDFSTNDLMLVSNLLVTDYSSVIFEYALLKKPIAFFGYDLAVYDRGFYLNYPDDLPGDIYTDQDTLTEYLVHTERHVLTEKYHTFAKRYMSACDGNSCERIAEIINDYMAKGQ